MIVSIVVINVKFIFSWKILNIIIIMNVLCNNVSIVDNVYVNWKWIFMYKMIIVEVISIVINVFCVIFLLIVGEIVFMFGFVLYLLWKNVFVFVILFFDKIFNVWIVKFLLLFLVGIIFFFFILMFNFLKFLWILDIVMVCFDCKLICVLFVKLILRFNLKIGKIIVFVIIIIIEKIRNLWLIFMKLIWLNFVGGCIIFFVNGIIFFCFILKYFGFLLK